MLSGNTRAEICELLNISDDKVGGYLHNIGTALSSALQDVREKYSAIAYARMEELYALAREHVVIHITNEDGTESTELNYKAMDTCLKILRQERDLLGDGTPKSGTNVNLTQNNYVLEPTLISGSDMYKEVMEEIKGEFLVIETPVEPVQLDDDRLTDLETLVSTHVQPENPD